MMIFNVVVVNTRRITSTQTRSPNVDNASGIRRRGDLFKLLVSPTISLQRMLSIELVNPPRRAQKRDEKMCSLWRSCRQGQAFPNDKDP